MPPSPEISAGSLEELILAVLERAPEEHEAVIEELCRSHPSRAAGIRARIEVLRSHGLIYLSGPDEQDTFPARLGDFRLLERLGEGGMGVVYAAEQVSLGRRVALKLVRPEHLYFPHARERFRREVEAVASLSHPSIVPVYLMGEELGLPYFAMELVEGLSLSQVLRALAERDPSRLRGADLRELVMQQVGGESAESAESGALFAGSWTECCLQIARIVSEALQHSHERGVLHRDVKPSNVMITARGEVKLLDFGLASSSANRTAPKAGSLTRPYDRLGSLPYMAPEQVDGRHDQIDARTDVYGLGVTLYELLALRRPHGETSEGPLARAILAGSLPPLRRFAAHVPADVETVCHAALAPERARRYASAGALARDLGNLLELRPIEARPAGRLLRTRRWSQRNPGWAAAAALGVLLVVGGALGFGLQQHFAKERLRELNERLERANLAAGQANEELGGALEQAEHQRARAESTLEKALAAVGLLTEIGDERLAELPAGGEVRREILEEALAFYRAFLDESEGDLELRDEVARASLRSGALQFALGELDQARASFESALELFEALRGTSPLAYELDYARTLTRLAELDSRRGETAAAEQALRRALLVLEPCFADAPTEAAANQIVELQGILSHVLITQGRTDEAVALLEGAQQRYEEAMAQSERQAPLPQAWLLLQLGSAHLEARQSEPARSAFQSALEVLDGAPATERDLDARTMRGQVHLSLGKLEFAAGRPREAIDQYELGREVVGALAREHPGYVMVESLLAKLESNIAVACFAAGQRSEGRAALERALPVYRALVGAQPEALTFAGELGSLLGNLATSQFLAGEWSAAEASYREAIPLVEAAIEADTAEPDQHLQLPRLRLNLAWTLVNEGLHAGVQELLERVPMPDEAGAREPLFAAYLLGECRRLALLDETLDEAERSRLAGAYADRACQHLARALDITTDLEGLPDVLAMERYDSLRYLPAFQALLEELDAQLR